MPTQKKTQNLEQSLNDLEKLVDKLNDSKLSLEESLQLFENGVKLTRMCQTKLQQAEQKIQQLTEEDEP